MKITMTNESYKIMTNADPTMMTIAATIENLYKMVELFYGGFV